MVKYWFKYMHVCPGTRCLDITSGCLDIGPGVQMMVQLTGGAGII